MTELEEFLEAVTKDDIKDYKPTIEGENTYTILDKLNAVLLWLKEHPDMVGTVVRLSGVGQKYIDFVADPQRQLDTIRGTLSTIDDKTVVNAQGVTRLEGEVDRIDALVDALDATKADNATVETKQDYFTYKYEGDFNVTDINDFRTKIYEQRKNTVRRWQLEINPYNLDLMSVLGYPDDGISTADKAFLYVEVPYSEAGGFEIDLKLMKRDGSRIFERVMASTLDSNWSDTGWVNVNYDLVKLATQVETNATNINKKLNGEIIGYSYNAGDEIVLDKQETIVIHGVGYGNVDVYIDGVVRGTLYRPLNAVVSRFFDRFAWYGIDSTKKVIHGNGSASTIKIKFTDQLVGPVISYKR